MLADFIKYLEGWVSVCNHTHIYGCKNRLCIGYERIERGEEKRREEFTIMNNKTRFLVEEGSENWQGGEGSSLFYLKALSCKNQIELLQCKLNSYGLFTL